MKWNKLQWLQWKCRVANSPLPTTYTLADRQPAHLSLRGSQLAWAAPTGQLANHLLWESCFHTRAVHQRSGVIKTNTRMCQAAPQPSAMLSGTGICTPLLVNSRLPLQKSARRLNIITRQPGSHLLLCSGRTRARVSLVSITVCALSSTTWTGRRQWEQACGSTGQWPVLLLIPAAFLQERHLQSSSHEKPPPHSILLNYLSSMKETCTFTITYRKIIWEQELQIYCTKRKMSTITFL